MGIETTPVPTDETKEETMKVLREDLKKGKIPEEIKDRAKEMFGESKLANKEPLKNNKEEDGCIATHHKDGTISFKYDDEKKEDEK